MELDVIVGNNVSSTGPIGQLQGMFLGPENHGVGAIDLVTGITCFVYHSGSALCGELYGFEVQVNVGNVGPATTLAAYYAKTPSFLGGGSATNVYGLLIDDQSGLGGTQSLNILSRGAGSNNLFEGKVSANVSLVGARRPQQQPAVRQPPCSCAAPSPASASISDQAFQQSLPVRARSICAPMAAVA